MTLALAAKDFEAEVVEVLPEMRAEVRERWDGLVAVEIDRQAEVVAEIFVCWSRTKDHCRSNVEKVSFWRSSGEFVEKT
jgi:hypothetical protein